MKFFTVRKLKSLFARPFLSWLALYVLIVGGAGAWASEMYRDNNEHRLPSGKIELSVSKTRYQLGETVEFTVTNRFPVPIFVTNNCPNEPLDVYEWRNGTWVQLHDRAKENSECFTQERNVEIPSEGARSYNFSDWPNLFKKPGVYRIATKIDHSSDIPFQDFAVLEPARIVEVKGEPPPGAKPAVTPPPTEQPQEEIYTREDDAAEYREEEDD